MTPAEQRRAKLEELRTEIRTLAAITDPLSEEQEQRLDTAMTEFKELEPQVVKDEQRARDLEHVTRAATGHAPGVDVPNQINRDNPFAGEIRGAPKRELRDRAKRVLEDRGKGLNDRQRSGLERLLDVSGGDTDGSVIAQRMLLTENDDYRSAFAKLITLPHPVLTPDEADAVNRFRQFERDTEFRAANEGTGSAGGFGVPVLIDPTIILTSGAADAPILDISRVITITTNQWKGVSSAGFTWAYDTEGGTVADNTPVLAQPTIPVYRADGFIPYTIELEQDYPGFEGEMRRLLEQGYINLMAVKTMTGTGVNEPTGIFTAMSTATTAPAHIAVTTAGTLGAADVRKAWGALPERFRPNAKWVANVSVENVIRAWGNNLALSDYTINMTQDGEQLLMGRQFIDSDYAPNFTGQTTVFNFLVVGDFQHFIIAQRAGMSVELVPHLFDTSTGRPIGERGWFAWARVGHAPDSTNAFRAVTNT